MHPEQNVVVANIGSAAAFLCSLVPAAVRRTQTFTPIRCHVAIGCPRWMISLSALLLSAAYEIANACAMDLCLDARLVHNAKDEVSHSNASTPTRSTIQRTAAVAFSPGDQMGLKDVPDL